MSDIFDSMPGWHLLGHPRRGTRGITVRATYRPEPTQCPKCDARKALQGHGRKETAFRHLPDREGRPVTIVADRRRYRCLECGATSLQPLPDMNDEHRMSAQLIEFIETDAVRRPFTAIADELGVHERTIRRVVDNRLPNVTRVPRGHLAPLVLGIHQVEIQGRRRAVLVDVGDLRVLDVLRSVGQRALGQWIDKLGQPRRVQVVSIDVDLEHRDLVRMTWGSRPLIVVNRRHFDRLATGALAALGDEQSEAARETVRRAVDGFLAMPLTVGELDVWLAGLPKSSRRPLAPLRKALAAWRRDLLVQRDDRVVGAPWDALHNWLMRVEELHRDDEFGVARAMILGSPEIPGPPEFDRCDQCGRGGGEHRVHARFTVPIEDVPHTPNARLRRTCFDCRPRVAG